MSLLSLGQDIATILIALTGVIALVLSGRGIYQKQELMSARGYIAQLEKDKAYLTKENENQKKAFERDLAEANGRADQAKRELEALLRRLAGEGK